MKKTLKWHDATDGKVGLVSHAGRRFQNGDMISYELEIESCGAYEFVAVLHHSANAISWRSGIRLSLDDAKQVAMSKLSS